MPASARSAESVESFAGLEAVREPGVKLTLAQAIYLGEIRSMLVCFRPPSKALREVSTFSKQALFSRLS